MQLIEDAPEGVSAKQIFDLVRRNALFVALWTIFFALLGALVTDFLPHFYKARAVLSIQSSYFQHPLVSDLISEVQEASEMSGQRTSLLRLALDDQFLDSLGDKYGFYEHTADSPLRALDREMLLKKIEYFSVTPSSFQISITTRSPETSYRVTEDILAQMTYTLIDRRYQILMKARDSILKQAKLLKTTLNDAPTPQQEALETKLATMEAHLAALRARFTESHPEVIQTRGQVQALSAQVPKKKQEQASDDDYTNVFLSPASRASTQEIFNDLLKKLSHLNIVLEMERDRSAVSYLAVIEKPSIPITPVFPKRLQMLMFGALAGFVVSALRVAYLELQESGRVSPEDGLSAFGLELLGELPPLPATNHLLLLGGKQAVAGLPQPQKET